MATLFPKLPTPLYSTTSPESERFVNVRMINSRSHSIPSRNAGYVALFVCLVCADARSIRGRTPSLQTGIASGHTTEPEATANTKTATEHGSEQTQSSLVKPASNYCMSVAEAIKNPDKDLCVSLHVFNVVELPDGTRFLDVCPVSISDDSCRFTILSPKENREEVGDLRRYQNQDIKIRGVVLSTHGRMGLVLSHVRQFTLAPDKFRPNPRLLRNFDVQSDRYPVSDPNLKSSGRGRSFMNTRDSESIPLKR